MTPSNYAAFITTTDTTIGAIYSEMDPASTYKQYTRERKMEGSILALAWKGMSPKPRPWYGSRMQYEVGPQTYLIEPIPYELTMSIEQFTLDDSDVNQMSVFWRDLPDMARQWRRQPEYEIRDLLENAGVQATTARQNGLDGTSFFGTAHPINFYAPTFNNGSIAFANGTYINDFIGGQTVNGVVIGGALSTTAFSSLRAYMGLIPAEDGETLGLIPDAMIIPVSLEDEANFILRSTLLAAPSWGAFAPLTGQVGSADNMLAKVGVRPIINRWLRKTQRWYLADTSHAEKPLQWVVREAPRTVPRIAPDDPIVFDSHRYTWGGWDRVCPAWSYSWLLARSGPTGS